MSKEGEGSGSALWARFRFSIVGPLLAAPPLMGELEGEIEKLAAKKWTHPCTGEPVTFGFSTIERWYYIARGAGDDPIRALRRRVRKDAGQHPSLNTKLRAALRGQYNQHKGWTYRLHADNLEALVENDPELGPLPSYQSIRRYMRHQGMYCRRRRSKRKTEGAELAEQRLDEREVRSYEAPYVHSLWHWDFHGCSRKVLTPSGTWETPQLFAVLDDFSRLACHVQWYLVEEAETVAHGLSQGFQKRGLPWKGLCDNGGGNIAADIKQAFEDLSIIHDTTLPYSPDQNAKIEVFWNIIEGRLMPMLENVEELTLDLLNRATLALVELDYNRKVHSEIGTTPLERFTSSKSIGRKCPSSEELRQAFRRRISRAQRKSDGTVSLDGQRFEIPSRYRHLDRIWLRYAPWDLSYVHMIDPQTDVLLSRIYPLDKARNSEGHRRPLQPLALKEPATEAAPSSGEMAPLLKNLMAEYASTGLPPAYIPMYLPPSGSNEEETR